MSRTSLLPSVTVKFEGPKSATPAKCVGCGQHVNPGFSYTGSIIVGLGFRTLSGSTLVGSDVINTSKRYGYWQRRKGYLCDSCASNYHTIEDSKGVKHAVVITDPRPGFIRTLGVPVYEKIRSKSGG